ncbi:SurA N-terminal domain-containing protein [Oceanobacillus halophilus]|uniref:Peptidylprolyl isomerase n=1 Tax=Oceanobacillus halophilus TaxID=930130 RepID=A0A494ZW31_9BACI|nr:SurA N-terminal domain-containing protein [Oceanobacillus halophilus]RKQ30792.1 peptidylprolyl isomerase [Oceanobacillus halophilus]
MNKKWLLTLTFVLAAIVLAACGNDEESAEDNTEEVQEDAAENAEQPEMPEPDLEDIPEVVAEVNGQEISKEDFVSTYQGQFQQAAMQAQFSGQELDQELLKEQMVESLIGQELLIQEADNRAFDVSDEEVNETLDQLAQQSGLESQDDLLSALQEQGMEEQEIMSLIKVQVKVDKLIAEESGDIEPTEEELQEAYDQIIAYQEQMESEEELPSFDEMKPDLEAQVKSQKESEVTQTLVDKLRDEAEVTINL